MKKLFMYAVLIGIVILAGCSKEASHSEVTVIAGSTLVDSLVMTDVEEEPNPADNNRLFRLWMDNYDEISYVELGETVIIEADRNVTGTYEMKDFLLMEDGTLKYTTQQNIEPSHATAIQFEQGAGSFALTENKYAYLSSQSHDYESGAASLYKQNVE